MSFLCEKNSHKKIITHNCAVDKTKVLALLKYLSELNCDINLSEYEEIDNCSFVELLTVAIEKCDQWLEIPNLNDFEYTAHFYVVLIEHVFENEDRYEGCVLLEKFLNKMITCNFTVRSQLTKLKFIKQWFIVMRNDKSRVGIWCKYLIRGCSLRKFTSFLLPSHEELVRTVTMDIPILLKLDLLTESVFMATQLISQPDYLMAEPLDASTNDISGKQWLDMYFKLLLENCEYLVKYKGPKPEFSATLSNNSDDPSVVGGEFFDKSSYMVTISSFIVHHLITNIQFLAMVYTETLGSYPTTSFLRFVVHGQNQNIPASIVGAFESILSTTVLGTTFQLLKAMVSIDDLNAKLARVSDILNDQVKQQLNITNVDVYYDICKKIDFVYNLKPLSETSLDLLASVMPSITSDSTINDGIEAFLIHLQQLHLFQCEIDGLNNTVKILSNIMHNSPTRDQAQESQSLGSSLNYLSDIAEKFKLLSQSY